MEHRVYTLPCGREVLYSACDQHILDEHEWRSMVCASHNTVYVQASRRGAGGNGTLLLHREIFPDAEVVHHENGNGLDNTRTNLRPSTQAENCWAKGPMKGRRFKGVIRTKSGKFFAQLEARGVKYRRPVRETEEEAAHDYDQLADLHQGAYGYRNYPNKVGNNVIRLAERSKRAGSKVRQGNAAGIPGAGDRGAA